MRCWRSGGAYAIGLPGAAFVLLMAAVAPADATDPVGREPGVVPVMPSGSGTDGTATEVRHLRLLRSEPAAGATVPEPPRELRLWFSQRPELAMTSARLTSGPHVVAAGRAVLQETTKDGVLVVLPVVGVLPDGRWTVAWRTMAPDGHVITGEFAFTIASSHGR